MQKSFSKNGIGLKGESHIDLIRGRDRLPREFYLRDVLIVAPEILGKYIVVRLQKGLYSKFRITDVEAYRGSEDKACHASKGRTVRTDIMFREGGYLYVYLIYGIYWMLNVVTGCEDDPQAVLIRGVDNISGPGKTTKMLKIDSSFNKEDLVSSDRIWIEGTGVLPDFRTGHRIGIDYAGEYWKSRPWRYYI